MKDTLNGIRVLELGQVLAGPFAGAILSDLGAEVIKLERVDGGDDARQMGPAFRHGDALTFQIFNRGKKSVTVNLKSEEGLDAFERLVSETDILMHNLRPGVATALGIDAAAVCTRHPRIVYCEISAFGHRGPMSTLPGYEPLMQAFSGLSSINGGSDDPPMRTGASICDQGTGMWAVIGALALLQRRQLTGRGGVVQTSLLETALAWTAQKSDAWLNEGVLPQRHRTGHPGMVPYEAFDTSDGPLIICCGNDRLFSKLAHELGHKEWLIDPRFTSNRSRLQHKNALLAEIAPILIKGNRAHWMQRLQAIGVPCAPVHSVPEALAHPQVQALGIIQPVAQEDFQLTGLPMSIDGVRPALRGPAPRLGQDNQNYGLPAWQAI